MFDLCQVIIRAVTRPFFYPTFAKVMLDLSQASSRVVARPFFYPSFPKFRMDLLINFLGCFITILHNLFVHCSEWKGPGIHNFLNKLFNLFFLFLQNQQTGPGVRVCVLPAPSVDWSHLWIQTERLAVDLIKKNWNEAYILDRIVWIKQIFLDWSHLWIQTERLAVDLIKKTFKYWEGLIRT